MSLFVVVCTSTVQASLDKLVPITCSDVVSLYDPSSIFFALFTTGNYLVLVGSD